MRCNTMPSMTTDDQDKAIQAIMHRESYNRMRIVSARPFTTDLPDAP
jgi:hypothetical protein